MLVAFARWVGGIALHWFYRDVRVIHQERIPDQGALIIAMNHRNALVDAVLAMWIVPRDLRITAKATIAQNPFGNVLVRAFGIVSLRRSSDESRTVDRARNEAAFATIERALRDGEAVLMFPEGRSHNEPGIVPLKTGLARAALGARLNGIHGIRILPIGIVFEDKAQPGTDVMVAVGEPIDVDAWPDDDPRALTAALAARLATTTDIGGVQLGERTSAPSVREHRATTVRRLLAHWGELTHRAPLTLARRWAIEHSTDADQPAMYTMTFGLALVLASYAIVFALLWWLATPIIAVLVIASLVGGAHAAAYMRHDRTSRDDGPLTDSRPRPR